ncbi:lipopolysaccharide export system permease protein [Candidatus Kinetoplastibacterium blastocrithidii TCC012E]|uniref:Lipopolysaccharide export system permease protein n=1 Tax=Candidatus Kinetoplastidibacterium blastocrithidiae TCC012E TaxID=1208922 RepID=M1LWZ2_9PROT|nr:LptF/LptG family permease [Candidatus Kinetoplastibacterium blastocrithidii]AFZ83228.1 hypothetical protein CKBE_00039 [Candidatus Kinetoplastibacterium blastocrithidii (ex Strigomonas culicis)]AGF50042.1 lipopolysaccharide export system permease protein [Candidatus Kinetoplastibacterium blastocrithidii TCC012E]
MFTINSYLAKNTYRSCLIVLLSLLSLFTIFSLIETIEDIDSITISIFYFQILSAPGRLYDLIPISILIGTVLSINWLSINNEWLILNMSGISNIKLISTLWLINIPIVIFSLFLSEYIVPVAEMKNLNNQVANKKKQNNNQFISGYWINENINSKNTIININDMKANGEIEKITLYEFGQNRKLAKIYFADHGKFIKKQMILKNVIVKTLNNPLCETLIDNHQKKYIDTIFFENIRYDTNINKEFLLASKLPIDRVPLSTLFKYKKSNIASYIQEVELYNKLLYILSLFLMISIATNIIKNNHIKNGNRIIETLVIGIILFIIIKLCPIIGSFYNLSIISTTLIPGVAITILSICNIIQRENIE